MKSLRNWKQTHFDEHISVLEGHHEDELFHNCTFDKIARATLRNCCLSDSKFNITKLDDAIGFTMTLDCNHFANVELSEFVFDYVLFLLVRTKGNVEKRKQLIKLLGGDQKVLEMLHFARHKE